MYDDEKGSFEQDESITVIDGDHVPVTRAKKAFDGTADDAIRPFADISAVEWAKYKRAKSITDNAKLYALMPAYIKTFLNRGLKRDNPEFSDAELRHVPGAPAKLPNMLSRQRAEVLSIPQNYDYEHRRELTTAEYVRAFELSNHLIFTVQS